LGLYAFEHYSREPCQPRCLAETMKVLRRGWFQNFAGGLILLFLVEWALVTTHNPNYIPSVIVLGAFLVPVAFVSYLYARLQN
jgi:protease PrsW